MLFSLFVLYQEFRAIDYELHRLIDCEGRILSRLGLNLLGLVQVIVGLDIIIGKKHTVFRRFLSEVT